MSVLEALQVFLPHWWNLPVYASVMYLAVTRGLPSFYVILPRWWNLPLYLAVLYLGATREYLSEHNLYDTYLPGERPTISCDGINTAARTLSGACNSLDIPAMGAAGTRFARQELFKRKTFKPATSINNLASAWIQFQTHDWFSHGPTNDPAHLLSFPLPMNDPLRATGQTHMSVRRTLKDTHHARADTYNNINTHWWDLSQVYGADEERHATLRSFVDGKMKVAEDGLLPVGPDGLDITGYNDNWWAGLSLLHNIWVKEHNLVCDMFKASYPTWNDTQLFDHARLVTTALNAKIHTTNWNGLAPKWLRFIPSTFLSQHVAEAYYGILGGKPDFAGVPFAHSEEFISIYRFHSLLRDSITIRNHVDNRETGKTYDISEYTFRGAQEVIRGNKFGDVLYTFGTDNPGALPGAPSILDMGVIDILRDRERGVPRYNEFRRLFALVPAKKMDDISDDKDAVAALRRIYGEDVEAVDLLSGTLAESPRRNGLCVQQHAVPGVHPRGIAPPHDGPILHDGLYGCGGMTKALDWIERSDFREVIGRTVPELNASVHSVDNAFKPWVVSP
ncbi:heme peroxidase [Mycena olivaceomarginata]|nr:heme peroxidase [Mycena olivaceomarginata]